jgi:hypothetical protein
MIVRLIAALLKRFGYVMMKIDDRDAMLLSVRHYRRREWFMADQLRQVAWRLRLCHPIAHDATIAYQIACRAQHLCEGARDAENGGAHAPTTRALELP